MRLKSKKLLLQMLCLLFILAAFSNVFAVREVIRHPMSLHDEVCNGTLSGVKILVNRGAKVNEPDEMGMTPLHYAAWQGRLAAVRFLIQSGANIFLKNNAGMTPLHYAAQFGRALTVKCLLKHGGVTYADVKDNIKRTALHYAYASRSYETVRYLMEIGFAQEIVRDDMGKLPSDYENTSRPIQSDVELRLLLQNMKICPTSASLSTLKTIVSQISDEDSERKTKTCAKDVKQLGVSVKIPLVDTKIPVSHIRVGHTVNGSSLPFEGCKDCIDRVSISSFASYPIEVLTDSIYDQCFNDDDYPCGWRYYAMFYPDLLKSRHYDLLFSKY